MTESKHQILLVDDEENCLRAVSDVFELENITCFTANNATRALDIIEREEIDIVISDVRMPGKTGMDLLVDIKKIRPDMQVIMLTGYGSINDAVESMKLGAYQYILKPVIMEDLLAMVKELQEKIDQQKNHTPFEELDVPKGKKILGKSPRIQNIAKLISKISNTDLPVLIVGESGTGKELAATAIHYGSDRAKGPFVAINCPAFPETLLESELFGYEKGAFTDAKTSKQGKIEIADGGTLFLDEIGDMKPAMQAKLLRVLEEQEFQRLGSNKSHQVDIRIISATNRDLIKAMQEGMFRPDLYYRLNAVNVVMPPLREIREDIPILANYFLQDYSKNFNRKSVDISRDAMEALKKYHWPGNVREMANALRRALALSEGNNIKLYDLPSHITTSDLPVKSVEIKQKSLLLDDIEREHIKRVLDMTEGNKSLAAQMLGIHRDTLLRKIKKYES
ncbi:sigma-54-dependent Fis family transcriptional regulator [candidate division KSB1 bacterium]|nr:sigma-54-dependent Fis family transcriptional regulator [candidate division KSB1 bacterium]